RLRSASISCARRPAVATADAACSASSFDARYVSATSAPRPASATATAAPMRLPPVMSATVLVRFIDELSRTHKGPARRRPGVDVGADLQVRPGGPAKAGPTPDH